MHRIITDLGRLFEVSVQVECESLVPPAPVVSVVGSLCKQLAELVNCSRVVAVLLQGLHPLGQGPHVHGPHRVPAQVFGQSTYMPRVARMRTRLLRVISVGIIR